MKNILIITAKNCARGGVQTYLKSWFLKCDLEKYKFTWYFPGEILDLEYYDEFLDLGIKMIDGSMSCNTGKFKIYHDISNICKKEHFDIAHINTGLINITLQALLALVFNNIKTRIAHSHNAIFINNNFSTKIKRKAIRIFATKLVACSKDAAMSLFGTYNFIYVRNCIDTKKYIFNCKERNHMRKELNIENAFVIGHVGKFIKAKNHKFLIDIFCSIKEKHINAKLLLIGDGPLTKEVKEMCKVKNILGDVIFVGSVNNVEKYLQVMDIFFLPSLYEGFGIACLEAQCNGLKCVVSQAVPREIEITDLVEFVDLNDMDKWKEICFNNKKDHNRGTLNEYNQIKDFDLKEYRRDIEILYGDFNNK